MYIITVMHWDTLCNTYVCPLMIFEEKEKKKKTYCPGGYADLSWTGVCRSSLKTPTQ